MNIDDLSLADGGAAAAAPTVHARLDVTGHVVRVVEHAAIIGTTQGRLSMPRTYRVYTLLLETARVREYGGARKSDVLAALAYQGETYLPRGRVAADAADGGDGGRRKFRTVIRHGALGESGAYKAPWAPTRDAEPAKWYTALTSHRKDAWLVDVHAASDTDTLRGATGVHLCHTLHINARSRREAGAGGSPSLIAYLVSCGDVRADRIRAAAFPLCVRDAVSLLLVSAVFGRRQQTYKKSPAGDWTAKPNTCLVSTNPDAADRAFWTCAEALTAGKACALGDAAVVDDASALALRGASSVCGIVRTAMHASGAFADVGAIALLDALDAHEAERVGARCATPASFAPLFYLQKDEHGDLVLPRVWVGGWGARTALDAVIDKAHALHGAPDDDTDTYAAAAYGRLAWVSLCMGGTALFGCNTMLDGTPLRADLASVRAGAVPLRMDTTRHAGPILRLETVASTEARLARAYARLVGPAGRSAFVHNDECTWDALSGMVFGGGGGGSRLSLIYSIGTLLYRALWLVFGVRTSECVFVTYGAEAAASLRDALDAWYGPANTSRHPATFVLTLVDMHTQLGDIVSVAGGSGRTVVLLGAARLGERDMCSILEGVGAAKGVSIVLVGDINRFPRQPAHNDASAMAHPQGAPFTDLFLWADELHDDTAACTAPACVLFPTSPLAGEPFLAGAAWAWRVRASTRALDMLVAGQKERTPDVIRDMRAAGRMPDGARALTLYVPGAGNSVVPTQQTAPCPLNIAQFGFMHAEPLIGDERRALLLDKTRTHTEGARGELIAAHTSRGAAAHAAAAVVYAERDMDANDAMHTRVAVPHARTSTPDLASCGLPACMLDADPALLHARTSREGATHVVLAQCVADTPPLRAGALIRVVYDLMCAGVDPGRIYWLPLDNNYAVFGTRSARARWPSADAGDECVCARYTRPAAIGAQRAAWTTGRPPTGLPYELSVLTV